MYQNVTSNSIPIFDYNCFKTQSTGIMNAPSKPDCSNSSNEDIVNVQTSHSNVSQEIANTVYNQSPSVTPDTSEAQKPFFTNSNIMDETNQISQNSLPFILVKKSYQTAVSSHPLRILCSTIAIPNHPQSLFLQALSKLNENTLNCVTSKLKHHTAQPTLESSKDNNVEITPPNSLTSAPPSYSFVLRQTAARRPRLMGTFIPSPSFVQHTPPPNYATAYDIYVDNPIAPPPPPRTYTFGFTPMLVVCSDCGYTGMTVIRNKITICTHMCSLILCLLCCWVCAPLPYLMPSCKDVYHYCRNCRQYLGQYSLANPENR